MLRCLIIGSAATVLAILLLLGQNEARSSRYNYDYLKIDLRKKGLLTKQKVFDSYVHLTDLEDYPDVCSEYDNENCATAFLRELDPVQKRNANRMANIEYRSTVNITKENLNVQQKFQTRVIYLSHKLNKKLKKFKWASFRSPMVKRMSQIILPTIASKNKTISAMLVNISRSINLIYNHALPCSGVCLPKGEPGIIDYFQRERDYDKLMRFWSAWRNVTGRRIRNLFIRKIELNNIGAKENGYSDAASFDLKNDFEEDNFNETVLRLNEEILPLYRELHGFVRYCLAKFYPGRFDERGAIPAHILGNVWGQMWGNIFPILQRCRGKVAVSKNQREVNEKLKSGTVKEMFLYAEDFFTSIGMFKMTKHFWERSVVEKPVTGLMDCHGSANDFSNTVDFRIAMCTKKDFNDLYTVHHEMGHIEYFMAYRNLPFLFQESATGAFHEAIGDAIMLSSSTPQHLKRIGLLSTFTESADFDIDYLLQSALDRVSFLPYALTVDAFRWGVYNGSVPFDKMNEYWWSLRYRFQGLKPPLKRSEHDFDPGSKYHISFGVSYIRYFISFIHQFQFYEAMCKLSGHTGPLHRCDFYGSKEAGEGLLKMLEKGRSQPWRDTLKILTGSRVISSDPITKYYEPLYKWLKETNRKLNVPLGW